MKYFDKWVLTNGEPPKTNVLWVKPTDENGVKGAEINAFIDGKWRTASSNSGGGGSDYPPEGGVPKSDLSTSVQASLDKADTAYQKDVSGIPKSDLNASVQASLDKADTAIQYDGGTENSSGVTNVAITIDGSTYYSTNTIYTLNPEESIRYICESVNHNTYIIDADASPKTLLVESNYGEVRFSNTTDSVMHVQGACIQNGDTFTVQISRVGLKDMRMHIVETSTTSLIAQVNTLYRFSSSVDTLNITLPAITDMTRTHEIEFLLFMGENPSVTFTVAGGYGVRVQKDLVLSSLGTYELNAMWTGAYWLVAGIKLDQSGK